MHNILSAITFFVTYISSVKNSQVKRNIPHKEFLQPEFCGHQIRKQLS